MNKAKKAERGRVILGLLSASFGILGLIIEELWATGMGVGFALAWLITCFASVNTWIDDEADRIAPRHRKGSQK